MKILRSEVDWIEIEITILGTTNLKAMRRAVIEATCIERAYVSVLSDDCNSASTFRFRIHNPNKFAAVRAVLTRLDQRFRFALPPVVTAAEIALDDYSKGPEQVADWYFGLSKLADRKNHRLYWDFKGSGQAIPTNRGSLIRKIAHGYQIAIGNNNADFYQHGYYKQTDNNKQALPESEHRARIEVTLRGQQLPCLTLDEWSNFKFEQLAEYFRFRVPKDDQSEFEKMILEGRQIGGWASFNHKRDSRRVNNPLTKADPENERVRNVLRNLSRRWKSARSGRPSYEVSCGNSGNITTQNPNDCSASPARSNNYTSTIIAPTEQLSFLNPEGMKFHAVEVEQVQSARDESYKVFPCDSVLKTEWK